ncbi:MAG: serine dehydratase beta chain, partial [Bdellovibrionales bacterium]
MAVSVFDIFKVGIGPSSSHTMGPMAAAVQFCEDLSAQLDSKEDLRIVVDLFGSLALTGKGHGTDKAVQWGLCGFTAECLPLDQSENILSEALKTNRLNFREEFSFDLNPKEDIRFLRNQSLDRHPNAMRFTALQNNKELTSEIFYSLGGGFIISEKESSKDYISTPLEIPFPYKSGDELLQICVNEGMSISSIVMANEFCFRDAKKTENYLSKVWEVMQACIDRGGQSDGIVRGGVKVKRKTA